MSKYYNSVNESIGVLGDDSIEEKRTEFDKNFLKMYKGEFSVINDQKIADVKLPPTTDDSQCHWRWLQQAGLECWARDNVTGQNLDPTTCKYYKGRCYSTTAKQCTLDSQCGISRNGECKNKTGGGSLNCRHVGFLGMCSCVSK